MRGWAQSVYWNSYGLEFRFGRLTRFGDACTVQEYWRDDEGRPAYESQRDFKREEVHRTNAAYDDGEGGGETLKQRKSISIQYC